MPQTRLSHKQRSERRKLIADTVKDAPDKRRACHEQSKKYGLSIHTVYEICKAADIDVRPRIGELKLSTYCIIACLINEELSLRSIGRKFKLSYQRIQDIRTRCIQAGIPVRSQKEDTDE